MTHSRDGYCVLFDLDGTLLDTAPGLVETMNVLLAREGRPGMSLEALRPLVSHGAKAIISHAMAQTGPAADAAKVDALFEAFISHYRATMTEASTPYPGLRNCLDVLTARGLRLGICTNRIEASARELMKALGLDQYFIAVTGQDTYDAAKPDPTPVLETLKQMGGTSGQAMFVGDSEIDVAAARAAGLPVIVTSFGYGGMAADQLGADQVFDHYDDLPALIKPPVLR